jgi:hypothetical protein
MKVLLLKNLLCDYNAPWTQHVASTRIDHIVQAASLAGNLSRSPDDIKLRVLREDVSRKPISPGPPGGR